jgi:hypothetical protein
MLGFSGKSGISKIFGTIIFGGYLHPTILELKIEGYEGDRQRPVGPLDLLVRCCK